MFEVWKGDIYYFSCDEEALDILLSEGISLNGFEIRFIGEEKEELCCSL